MAQMKATSQGVSKASANWAAASIDARRSLTKATAKLQRQMAKQMSNARAARRKTNLRAKMLNKEFASSILTAKKSFSASLNRLGNTVSANAAKMKKDLQRLTGVVTRQAQADKAQRTIIRQQMKTMRDN